MFFHRTTPEDFGDFLCEAKNKYGVEVTEAELVQIGRYTNYNAINSLLQLINCTASKLHDAVSENAVSGFLCSGCAPYERVPLHRYLWQDVSSA